MASGEANLGLGHCVVSVRLGAVNGFAIDFEPTPKVKQALLLKHRDLAVSRWTYIDGQATTSRHQGYKMADQLIGSQIVFKWFVAVEAKGATDASTFSPWAVGEFGTASVFRSAEAMLLSLAPTVIDDSFIAYGVVVPRDQLGGMPLLRAVAPFAVSKKDCGLVGSNQFFELRNHVSIDIGSDGVIGILIPNMFLVGPFRQGIIETHLQSLPAYRLGQLTADVTMRSCLH